MSDALAKARERTEGEGLVGVFVDRQEFTAMLDAIEAAVGYLKLDLRRRTLDDAGRLTDALDRVYDLIGDDDE